FWPPWALSGSPYGGLLLRGGEATSSTLTRPAKGLSAHRPFYRHYRTSPQRLLRAAARPAPSTACDHAMAPRAPRPPAFPCWAALPGAGAVLAPRRRVACGA